MCDRASTRTSVRRLRRLLLCRAAADGHRADALDQLGHLVDTLGVAVGRRLHGAQRGHPPDHVWVRDERERLLGAAQRYAKAPLVGDEADVLWVAADHAEDHVGPLAPLCGVHVDQLHSPSAHLRFQQRAQQPALRR
eukprot:5484445-Prymnesium_polylepis.2